jgi:hypothetical protein
MEFSSDYRADATTLCTWEIEELKDAHRAAMVPVAGMFVYQGRNRQAIDSRRERSLRQLNERDRLR